MLSYADMVAEVAEHLARDDSHGYSQLNRAGDGGVEEVVLSDGTPVYVHTGDYDCSEMVRTCVAAAGLLDWDYWSSYMWTGNEADVLEGVGFVEVDLWGLQRGDVLWKTGHTGVYLGGGLMADAHGDERGGIDGPSQGDQTGAEIEIRPVGCCSWRRAWRYAGPEREGAEPAPVEPGHDTTGEDAMQPTTFRFIADTNVRDAPRMDSSVVATYEAGETVTVDALAYADGIVWGCYTGGSGNRRYVAIGHTDRVSQL